MAAERSLEYAVAVRSIIKQHPTLELAHKSMILDGSPLPAVIEAVGESAVYSLVADMMENYCRKFNLNLNMNRLQCVDTAMELLDDITRMPTPIRFEELAVFFQRAASGDFKTKAHPTGFPGFKIDRETILDLFDGFLQTARTEAVHALQDEKANAWKKDVVPIPRSSKGAPIMQTFQKANLFDKPRNNVIIPGITTPLKPEE